MSKMSAYEETNDNAYEKLKINERKFSSYFRIKFLVIKEKSFVANHVQLEAQQKTYTDKQESGRKLYPVKQRKRGWSKN